MNVMDKSENKRPPFLRGLEMVGDGSVLSFCRSYVTDELKSTPIKCDISATSVPLLITTSETKEIYQSNDFAKIRYLEKNARVALQPIFDNIQENGIDAWKVYTDGNEKYFIAESMEGCIWIRLMSQKVSEDGTKTICLIQQGTYSKPYEILGTTYYKFSIEYGLFSVVLAGILAYALSDIIAKGLGFTVAAFAPAIMTAAAAIGLVGLTCEVIAASIPILASCLVFFVVFIGLDAIWKLFNRRYTIEVNIYNWDDKANWRISDSYHDNAVIAGTDEDRTQLVELPKMTKPGPATLPPFIDDHVTVLDSVCYYTTIIYENYNTFMEGCCMALQFSKEDTGQGFMWAFACPYCRNNKQAARDKIMNPRTYYENANWSDTPLGFSIKSTDSNVPVTFRLDYLSGATDNYYKVFIQINNKS